MVVSDILFLREDLDCKWGVGARPSRSYNSVQRTSVSPPTWAEPGARPRAQNGEASVLMIHKQTLAN